MLNIKFIYNLSLNNIQWKLLLKVKLWMNFLNTLKIPYIETSVYWKSSVYRKDFISIYIFNRKHTLYIENILYSEYRKHFENINSIFHGNSIPYIENFYFLHIMNKTKYYFNQIYFVFTTNKSFNWTLLLFMLCKIPKNTSIGINY